MAAPSDQGKEDQWSQEDMLTLLETMKSILPSQDSLKFKTTESQLDWNKLAFKNYTGPVCRQKWIEISTKVRKFRTLSEVIQSAEEHVKNKYKGKKLKKHPKFPKIPLTSYMRYFVENRAKYAKLHPEMGNVDLTKMLSKKYKELPEKRKMKYSQDYQRKKQEFKRNLAKFREEHPDLMQATKKTDVPETPKTAEEIWQRTVRRVRLNNRAKAITCMESTWLNMEENKKIIWIKKAEDQKLSEML
ncbi:nucleolar transcription factor 1-B-like [Bufo gargarizans]|uniref:nucleolar transcription factor 1-B-like n=1 Tax=Bufo gargarizans TaxID=30331 RepID=UPI001CF45623|nr:nucleolar transcription factor 1-B-like [Bufo gargarizans]